MRFKLHLTLLFAALLLSACSFTLAADVTPPPGYQPPVMAEAPAEATIGPIYPLVPPDPEKGKPIFAEKCAPCHGSVGLGDGELSANLPNPVPAIGTSDVARQAVPAAWFKMVTEGNIEKRMPPFQSLTDRQRWDVVAYTFGLSIPPESVSLGADLYRANCVNCHGETGEGDGPEAAGLSASMPDFTDQEYMSGKSAADFFQAISSGALPAMPAFGDQLTEEERWAVTDYLRSLALAPKVAQATGEPGATPLAQATQGLPAAVVTQVQPTAEITETLDLGSIMGNVVNASGGDLPAGLEITLHAFEGMQLIDSLTTTLKEDGTYLFDGVELVSGRMYLSTLNYMGAIYGSDATVLEEGQSSLELPIQIYETTSDVSDLVVDRLHYFFEFVDERTLRVVELYIISNPGQSTVVAHEDGSPALTFSLPEGASNLQFEDGTLGERYVATADGFGDTLAVRPGMGEHQVVFSYEMPYSRGLELARPVNLATDAVVVLVPAENVKVKSDALQDAGTREVQGVQYRMYNGGSLAPGDELRLTITGHPASAAPSLSGGSSTGLILGVTALGLTLIIAGVWWFWRARSAGREDEPQAARPAVSQPESAESIMDAILALDDLYQEGQLPDEAYLQRRLELKARLKEALGS